MTAMNEELYISDWELGVVRLEDATEERHGVAGNDDIIRTSLIPAAAQPSGLHNSPVTVNKGTVLFANRTCIVLYFYVRFTYELWNLVCHVISCRRRSRVPRFVVHCLSYNSRRHRSLLLWNLQPLDRN